MSVDFEEFAVELAGRVLTTCAETGPTNGAPSTLAERRIATAVRFIELHFAQPINIGGLARRVGLSPFHFLRTFHRVLGITPHQFLLRRRLQEAAWRLRTSTEPVLDIALDSGFGDLSNFNHSFRVTFGISPTKFRDLTARTRARLAERPA
jgi:AraC-like DNA-binding protein